ncbi:hypothetical protein [Tritonibacter scottomollicae]|uniref:hypothetical protein n=1 Tax=Tritonibacter scottomollicae TaxID=483013 RepID=UPI003AA90024
MSAPDTNIEKEEKRHKPSLIAIRVSIVVVLVMLGVFLLSVANNASDDEVATDEVPSLTDEQVGVSD